MTNQAPFFDRLEAARNEKQSLLCVGIDPRLDRMPAEITAGRENDVEAILTRFGIELGGLDLLTPDIGVPLAECGGVINEVNTTPGLHHHVLIAEESKELPVAEMILEYIFGRAQERQAVSLAAEQVAPS